MPVAKQLKNAIETSGQSRYAIAKGPGLNTRRWSDSSTEARTSG